MPANSLERAALGFLLVTLYLGTACLLRRYWAYLRRRNAATPPAPARWTLALVDSQTGMSHVLDIDDSPSICCRRCTSEKLRSSLRSRIEHTVSRGEYLSSSGARQKIKVQDKVLGDFTKCAQKQSPERGEYTVEGGEVSFGPLKSLPLVATGAGTGLGRGESLTRQDAEVSLDALKSQIEKIVDIVVSGNSGLEDDVRRRVDALSLSVVDLVPGEATRFKRHGTKRLCKAVCCGKIVPSNVKLDFTTPYYTKGASGTERKGVKAWCLERCDDSPSVAPGKGLPWTVTSLTLCVGSCLLLLTFAAFWSETTPVGRSGGPCQISSTSASGFCNMNKIIDEGRQIGRLARARTNFEEAQEQALAAIDVQRQVEADVAMYTCLNSTSNETEPVDFPEWCADEQQRQLNADRRQLCPVTGNAMVPAKTVAQTVQPPTIRDAILFVDVTPPSMRVTHEVAAYETEVEYQGDCGASHHDEMDRRQAELQAYLSDRAEQLTERVTARVRCATQLRSWRLAEPVAAAENLATPMNK